MKIKTFENMPKIRHTVRIYYIRALYITVMVIIPNKFNTSIIVCVCMCLFILILLCSPGFGYDLAKQLSSLDVTVFACFLHSTADGGTSLKAHNPDRIHVIQLDVGRNDQVETAVGYVNKVTDNKGNLYL